MKSIEQRLQLGLAASLIVLTLALLYIGSQSLRSLTENFIASRLEHDAESILTALSVTPDTSEVNWQRIDQLYTRPFSGHYFVIRFSDGDQVISRSLWDHALEFPQHPTGESRQLHAIGPSGQQVLLFLRGFRKSGRDFTLAVGEDLTPLEKDREHFVQWFSLMAVCGLIVLLMLQSYVIRRSFRKLESVREDIRKLEEGRTGNLSEDVPSEVLPLIRELNHLLRLLNQRLERSRNALGNLAHALKGPLNLLTLFFNLKDPGEADISNAQNQLERVRQLMERELKRARLAGNGLSGTRFNPHRELPDLVKSLEQVYRERDLSISYRVSPEIGAFGDREDLLELVGNLLDNACKWAKSSINCTMSGNGTITLEIEDDGTGLEDEQISRMLQRGSRLDETVEGHGLGLAIVSDIVKLYHATITFNRSNLGGLCVSVVFPVKEIERDELD